MQRTRLERDLAVDADDRDPGLLLLDGEDRIEMTDDAAADWLEELRGRPRRLPL